MKITIDSRMINYLGIGRYIQGLIGGLKKINLDDEYILLGKKGELKEYEDKIKFKLEDFNYPIYTLREQIFLPSKLKEIDSHLFHFPHYVIPLFFSGKMVVTVHDLIHLIFPTYKHSFSYLYAYLMFKMMVKKVYLIICVSENTKKDLVRLFPEAEKKTVVIYEGIDKNKFYKPSKERILEFKERFNLQDYLLYVGNTKPHKNLLTLLSAISLLKKRKKANFKIVFAGKKDRFFSQIEKEIKRLALLSDFIFLDLLSDEDLPLLYAGALLFVFPSLYEGFGHPPLEAMACGVPVVAANTSSLPEILGEAAYLVNPKSKEEIAEGIERVLTDKNLQEEMKKKGYRQINKFSWEDTARQTVNIYNLVLMKRRDG